MKKLMLIVLAVATCFAASAVPARPGVYTFQQSDGTTIHVSRVGDEWNSSFVTTDGLTVEQNDKGDFYYCDANGLTSMRAHDVALRTTDEINFVASRREELNLASIALAKQNDTQTPGNGKLKARPKAAQSIKPIGTQYIPVILVSYSDVSFRDDDPVATFTTFFNSGASSVTQYFKDQSDNQFDPKFEILGHVELNNTRAYYGAHSYTWGNDVRCGTMVAHACQGISGVDWTKFDNDNNGEIDAVIVIYAGVGEASSDVSDAIWPCRWQIYGSDYGYKYVNVSAGSGTKRVNNFGVFNELSGFDNSKIDGIGTVCHEFSHVLGLPDYYATDYSNHFGMGDWSLMDGGCYNNEGYTPCAYASYERMFMGWRTLEDAVPGTTYRIADNSTAKGIKIPTDDANEYYILDNIQKTGWNEYAPNSGLLVTHVYYSSSAWSGNTVNNYDTRRMTIIPADNSLKMNKYTIDGETIYQSDSNDQINDSYPYGNNNELTDESTPAATIYTGSKLMGKPITQITKNSDGTVSFVYIASAAFAGDAPELTIDEENIGTDNFTANWNACSGATGYTLRVTPCSSLLTETFSKCVTASETSTNGSLDSYTDNSGWTGYRTRVQVGGFRLGNSGTSGTNGSLTYSALDLSNSNGKAIVQVTAFGYDGDDTPLSVTCGGQKISVNLSASPETYTLSFDKVTAETSQKIIFANETKGMRATITDVKVSYPDESKITTYDTSDTSLQVTGLESGSLYLVDAMATFSDGISDWSQSLLIQTKSDDIEYILGDANLDNEVNVFDVVTTALVILNKDVPSFLKVAADVNKDGIIDVTDVVGIVNISLGIEPETTPANAALRSLNPLYSMSLNDNSLAISPFSLKAGENCEVELLLNNADDLTAMQLDIALPEGLSITGLALTERNSSHTLANATLTDGSERILVYSSDNSSFTGNEGAVLRLTFSADDSFSGEGLIGFNNISLVNGKMQTLKPANLSVKVGSVITSIDRVYSSLKLYTEHGSLVVESPVAQSVSITSINGINTTVKINAGRNIISLPDAHGVYLVTVGNKTIKVRK